MRKIIIVFISSVVILLSGYVVYRSYALWKQDHMISLAREYLKKSDKRNALLCLEQALRSDRRNIEAARMMADLAEAERRPEALLWRSHVLDLNPFSLKDRLALVQTAMTMRDYESATNALAGVVEADKKTATYHNIAGALAAAINQSAEAEAHFLEASRLEPQNPVPQLNLAVVRLYETNISNLADARAVLGRLRSNPTNSALRCQALRELTMDALRHKDEDSALLLSSQLLQETNSTFGDSILRLGVLQKTHNAGFPQNLKDCQHKAAEDNARIYELANWQMANTSPGDVLSWLRSLPVKSQTNQPSTLLITECYNSQKDWRGVTNWLGPQSWGEMDFIRHAFQSRALRGLEMSDSGKIEWEQAFKGANGQKQRLVMLLRLAAQWNWSNEGEDLLHAIVTRYPNEEWAQQALMRVLFLGGQTRSMMQIFSQEVKRSPSNLTAKNNLALTALLLDAKEFKPYELASEVYQKSPTNASFISTYAFSLYIQKKNGEALKIIEQLKPQEFQKPSISGYYGLILKATGNRAKARSCLEQASKGYLLPEERKLFESAKSDISHAININNASP